MSLDSLLEILVTYGIILFTLLLLFSVFIFFVIETLFFELSLLERDMLELSKLFNDTESS